jgi:hypothetical protein
MVMKRLLIPAVMAGLFFSLEAKAQERAGSAAIGAVSGAVVLGPIGAVAGALIGFTAGPAIAHSWGVGRSAPRSRVRYTGQPSAGQEAAARLTPLPVAKPADAAVAKIAPQPGRMPEGTAAKNTPPVQGFD